MIVEKEDTLLQFFDYEHLPMHLQEQSKPFRVLAKLLCDTLPRNPERTVALRKLLEAKDCAVRARLFKECYGLHEEEEVRDQDRV